MAEIVPSASARLTAAARAVPLAPRARWRRVAGVGLTSSDRLGRLPRAHAQGASTDGRARLALAGPSEALGLAELVPTMIAEEKSSAAPPPARGRPEPSYCNPSCTSRARRMGAEKTRGVRGFVQRPQLRGWARLLGEGKPRACTTACHGPLPGPPMSRIVHRPLADKAALSSLALEASRSTWAYVSRCSLAEAHPLCAPRIYITKGYVNWGSETRGAAVITPMHLEETRGTPSRRPQRGLPRPPPALQWLRVARCARHSVLAAS